MLALHPEYVIDEKAKKKAVLVSLAEWQRLMEALEELEDIRAYDKAKARRESSVPLEAVVREIRAKGRK